MAEDNHCKLMNTFRGASEDLKNPRVYRPKEHSVKRSSISDGASQVMSVLGKAGYDAYLVGGGVRDLLLQRSPSDFDVATNATPFQISQIFKRSRMIGRRFKLVHVRACSEIVEVATFRRDPESRNNPGKRGIIFQDNNFGSIEEDAVRRDFTINALYLDFKSMNIFDYVGGMADLDGRVLRLIGKPKVRFSEDPVRVLRAVRFSEAFDFRMVGFSESQLRKYGTHLEHIPSARLFGEIGKLFLRGSATQTFNSLRYFDVLRHILPVTDSVLCSKQTEIAERFVFQALSNTDRRVERGGTVTLVFLIAVFLWESVVKEKEKQKKLVGGGREAAVRAEELVLSRQQKKMAIPRRITNPVREIWRLQNILLNPKVKTAEKILKHPRFRASYNFFFLRAQSGEPLSDSIEWWTKFFEK